MASDEALQNRYIHIGHIECIIHLIYSFPSSIYKPAPPPLTRRSPLSNTSTNAVEISPIMSFVIVPRPCFSKALRETVLVSMAAPTDASNGSLEEDIVLICLLKRPSSYPFAQASIVPIIPDRISPCPPHRFNPPFVTIYPWCYLGRIIKESTSLQQFLFHRLL